MFPVIFVLFFKIINQCVISTGGLMYWQYVCNVADYGGVNILLGVLDNLPEFSL